MAKDTEKTTVDEPPVTKDKTAKPVKEDKAVAAPANLNRPMTAAEQEGVVPLGKEKKPYVSPWPEGKIRGWEVSHPSYGTMKIWESDVATEDEAVEHFHKEICPTVTVDTLKETGLTVKVCWFTPATTEAGHMPVSKRVKK